MVLLSYPSRYLSIPFFLQVLINGNKYAWYVAQSQTVVTLLTLLSETCIKGHRSSTCRHTDRPLFEIKKKGRPVTQCDHCRELRKTKQVHVKCICEAKEDNSSVILPPAIKKGVSHYRLVALRLA